MRCASCILALLIGVATLAAAPTSRPTTAIEAKDCVTSDCHANIKAGRVVHGPVAVDACDACHELTDASKHTFKVWREKAELCTYCHEFSVASMPVVHKPVTLGECLGCHDPHGGNSHSLTRENSTPELCGRCHESITRGKLFLHGPVEKGACLSCHSPHAARFSKMLDVIGPDLCLTCHGEFEDHMARVKFTHRAMDEGCQKCHDPHGSSSPSSTTQPIAQQCTGCHAQVAQRAAGAKVKHSVVTSGRSCMSCHTPHGSDVAKLISDLPANVCLKCHDEPVKTDQGATIAAVTGLGDSALYKHGAIAQGQCAGCHEAHGSERSMLLSKTNSLAFYQPFAPEQYQLCFSCHDRRLVTEERVAGVTNFRDGERNLHYLHVTLGRRSHSCRACHDPHLAANRKLLRERIAYGIWHLPMRFEQTATGGTCTPGCHVPYSYDRQNPVGPASKPVDLAAIRTARADEPAPAKVRFSAKDFAGGDIVLPDVDRTSLVLLLADDLMANADLLRDVNVALRKGPDVSVVLVACGTRSREVARELNERPPIDGACVLVDDGGAMCEHLKVRAWPTILLVRSDGTLIARLGGSAEVLAMKLSQYLEPALTTSGIQTVTDGRRAQASRDLQVARDLLRQGKPAEAAALLEELPADELSASQRETMRGQIYLAMGQWDLAKASLMSVIAADPESAEAHALLGQVYEHEGDWKLAAIEYRTSRR